MATLPSANNTLALAASAGAGGDDLLILIAPVATSADAVPRQYGSADAIYTQHGYSEAVEYADLHFRESGLPILMCGIPIATAGAISREDKTGNTDTCVTTVTAGASGVLAEHDGVLTVVTGGTIGTDDIVLSLSLDGGLSTKKVRLGTSSSYTIPYVGATISFAAGDLTAGDTIHTWHGSGPRGDSTGWTSAFTALKAQSKLGRSMLVLGDFQTDTEVSALTTLLSSYETESDRFTYARVGVIDRLPLATMSNSTHRMSTTNVTFAEVGATGDTITRSSGSWATDGFATGDLLTISGSSSNDGALAAACTVTSPTVITLDTDDLADEGPVANVSITGEASLTFSDSADTITRAGGSPGSWVTDGFRVGDSITITGTSSNNTTTTVTNVTATVLSVTATALADEVIGITDVSIVAGQTKAAWMTAITTEFGPIDDEYLVDMSAGKARVLSTFSGWYLRWPAAWAASVREYNHDLHIPVWRKADGPTGWSLYDSDGQLVEYDDRVDGQAASAARFTSFRSYSNGPQGAFLANSLTRALDDSLMVQTHNTAVVQRARTICQAATEAAIGRSLVLNADGTASKEAIREIEAFVEKSLANDLLANKRGEGSRVSNVTWRMATDDDLSIAEPIVNGVLTIYLRGAIHTINTKTVVQ